VRDICSKANINVAMISYYFGSKEKMMSYLYQYRVQRTKESFSEFAQTIKEGKPEMQMKEIVNYVISLLFKYSYFHGFVTQEMRSLDNVKDDLWSFTRLVSADWTRSSKEELFPVFFIMRQSLKIS
jgi:AcrR family transcriptional regulator